MRETFASCAVAVALAIVATCAFGQVPHQGVRGVGHGPSRAFEHGLPSRQLSRTLGFSGGFTTAGDLAARVPPQATSYLAAPGYLVYLRRPGWQRAGRRRDTDVQVEWPFDLRVRTLDSFAMERRARFRRLRSTMVKLAERVRKLDETESLGEVNTSFRQLMFPVAVAENPEVGYGFFSRLDLVGAGGVDTEALLAPFTEEVQKSLGQERFLDVAQAMLFGRDLPEGVTLEQLYDPQLVALGNYLFNNGRFATSRRVWQALVDRDPTSSTRHQGLALALMGSRQLKQAARVARESLKRAPGYPDELRITGSNFQDVFPSPGVLADVRKELAAMLEQNPDDADLRFLRAYINLFHGMWDKAKGQFEALAPNDEVARTAVARLEAGAVDETIRRPARSVVREVAETLTGLEASPLNPEERRKLLEILTEGAETHEQVMRLGDYRFFMGDYTRAAEAYRRAHKMEPADPFALFALSHASFANGEFKLAVRYLKEALAREPGWGLYEFRIQEFYGDLTEFRKHLRNLERKLEIRPEATGAKFLLGYMYYFSGRFGDAAELLAQVVRDDPEFRRAEQLLRLARIQS